jgi:hypothetical protein
LIHDPPSWLEKYGESMPALFSALINTPTGVHNGGSPMSFSRSRLRCLAAVFLSAAALCAYAHDDGDRGGQRHHGDRDFGIEVLSGRPDMISGGDALVRVTLK